MKDISFKLKKSESNLVMMLVSEKDNKVVITIMITDDLVEKGNTCRKSYSRGF